MICDFCSDHHPHWAYPCKDFEAWQVNGVTGNSDGMWAACDICHDLIEANRRTTLVHRASHELLKEVPKDEQAFVIRAVKQMHDLFFCNRTGPAEPIKEETSV